MTAPEAAPAAIRVVLADDQPLIRAGLRVLIADTSGIEVIGEAANGAEAVDLARTHSPDVVLMDIRMPGMDGIEATRVITAAASRTRVLVLTTFDDDDYVYGALRAGASGFLVKDMALEDILTAIRVVAAGDALIAPSVTRRLIEAFAARPASLRAVGERPAAGQGSSHESRVPVDRAPAANLLPIPDRRRSGELAGAGDRGARWRAVLSGPSRRAGGETVTDREREVLALIGRGMSNSEIAAELVISIATVKAHVARLLSKLDARDRVQLVIIAYEAGLV